MADAVTKAQLSSMDSGVTITFQFNPTSFNISRKVNWAEQNAALQPWTTLQYGNGGSDTMSVTLFLDETEGSGSVLPTIQDFYDLSMPLQISGDVIRPPMLVFSWEQFKFQGVIQQLDIEVTLFDANGVPKRANVNLGLLGRAFADASSSTDFFGQTFSF